jgi:hypothetical protein
VIQHWNSIGISMIYSQEPIKSSSFISEMESVK